jgi:hypothetical protein
MDVIIWLFSALTIGLAAFVLVLVALRRRPSAGISESGRELRHEGMA